MTLLRRFAPRLSTLLVALVAVQTLDLVACADEAAAADHSDLYHVDGAAAAGAHPSPSPGGGCDAGTTHEEESPAMGDCLCHVVFTRTDSLPEVASSPAAEPAAYASFVASGGSVHTKPLDHVPLA